MNKKIGILGAGVMGKILAAAVRRVIPSSTLTVCDRDFKKLKSFKRMRKMKVVTDGTALAFAEVLFLAIKPQDVSSLTLRVPENTLVISIMAGVRMARIREKTGAKKIIRAMPNTAAKFNCGFTVWTATAAVSPNERQFMKRLFGHIGDELFVGDEAMLNRATAVSGSGAAYFLYTLQCFIAAAERIGFTKDEASRMVFQTFKGTQALLAHDADLERLINEIVSKRGTTDAALKIFKSKRLQLLWNAAVHAALERAEELSRLS